MGSAGFLFKIYRPKKLIFFIKKNNVDDELPTQNI